MDSKIKPYKDQNTGKKEQVKKMFDQIACRYDILNHLLSFGIDRIWRKRSVNFLAHKYQEPVILDIACGTGDFSIEALRLNPAKIIGVDISEGMLENAESKIASRGLNKLIEFRVGDAENLEFKDDSFDIIIVAFGVRNFENLVEGLKELYRVLNKKGSLLVLEFSKPRNRLLKGIYLFYFIKILPWIGKLISKNKNAYKYLPDSVMNFPDGDDFLEILKGVGFHDTVCKKFSFGISTMYVGHKAD